MSDSGPHRHRSSKAQFKPLQFGGWRDYQEWVDHDFMPCPGFCGVAMEEENIPDTTVDPSTVEIRPLAELSSADPAAESMDNDPSEAEIDVVDLQDPDLQDTPPATEFVVRPYVRTGGRAVPAYDLRLETMLVSRTPWAQVNPSARPPQHSDVGRICLLCDAPLSVAELSAYLRAPLGVVRILVGDAISQGLILVSGDDGLDGYACPSMQTLCRVREGLVRML